jgi:NADPH:quinone reductase-like Zn-dependent oxidoreductase
MTASRADNEMAAVRLHAARGPAALALDRIPIPDPGPDEALVRVHAAAITRDELDWPTDRLPAIPSYELSGVVASVGEDVAGLAAGDEVWALTSFERDGVAAEYAAVTAGRLAPKPTTISHVEAAAIPLPALSAWQALFDHGHLRSEERVLIHGAAGGVGQFATQLARWSGAYVIGTTSGDPEQVRELGADEAVGRRVEDLDPVDLVFDTVGGDALAHSGALVRSGGRIVSIAEEPPTELGERADASYFVVEPNRDELAELGRLVDAGALRAQVDSVFALAEAIKAFERVAAPGKRGKVVLRVAEE